MSYECPDCFTVYERKGWTEDKGCPMCMIKDLNRQHENRSWWRKLKDWWKYQTEPDMLIAGKLNIDQTLLKEIRDILARSTKTSHQLLIITWVLIAIGFVTLIVVLLKT